MNKFLATIILFLGCCPNYPKMVENTRQHQSDTGIFLYPGYVAKADGRIIWFPAMPEFDHENSRWVGNNSVEITSCVADPWPYGPGGAKSLMKIGSD